MDETPPHRSHDPATNTKRTNPFQFGQRYLEADDDIFEYNAWDHVTPDEAHYAYCEEQYMKQKAQPVSDFDKARFNDNPQKWWDLFYKQKTSTFFKDRKWPIFHWPIPSAEESRTTGRWWQLYERTSSGEFVPVTVPPSRDYVRNIPGVDGR